MKMLGDIAGLLGGRSDRSRRLLGGVTAGAMVGAALAGFVLHSLRTGSRRTR